MSWKEVLEVVIQFLVLPILIYAAKRLGGFLKEKMNAAKTDEERSFLRLIDDLVEVCVKATNQTFVDALKKEGKFDEAAHEEAFQRTLDSILENLTSEMRTYIESITDSYTSFFAPRIESAVLREKDEQKIYNM